MCDVYPSAWREEFRRARLPHLCDTCGHTIQRGERYMYSSGIWDGEPNDFKQHELCSILARQVRDDEGCWLPTEGMAQVENHVHPHTETFRRAWEAVMRQPWPEDAVRP